MNSKIKAVRGLMITLVLGLLWFCIGPLTTISAAVTANDITINIDGKMMKTSAPTLMREGRLYVSARMASQLGANAVWNSEYEELTIDTAFKDKIVLGNGVPVVYFNGGRYVMDAAPFYANGSLYVPLRALSEMLHTSLEMNEASDVIELSTVKQAVIAQDYGLDEIGKQYGSTRSELLKRNGLDNQTTIKPGMKLKAVVPSFFGNAAKPFTQADLTLLAKITMVEAGYEPYEGQLALANVILNRVKDPSFPDTIRDVIYSGRQFPPAHNGLLDKCKPNASSLRAAKDALNGKNNIKNAVYFFNKEVSKGPFWSSLDVIDTIGHHSFAR